MYPEFVETSVFTRRIVKLGLEAQLRELQERLHANPEVGKTDPETGGVKKVRIGDPGRGKGKRGGARVLYLYLRHKERIYLLYAYGKQESTKLTANQKKELRAVVALIKREK